MAAARNGQASDHELVIHFLTNREEKAFRELYRRHGPKLHQLVVRLVGSENGDADDVIQATWTRVVERLPGFRWESSLRTWLTGIALNCTREHRRKAGRRDAPGFDGDALDAIPGKEGPNRVNRAIERIDLERAIASLPAGYRDVLVLHDVEGYTHREIGGFLGIESGTSKSQLARARNAMRMRLNGHGANGNGRDEQGSEERSHTL